jgi:protein-export membrane protein SecD
MQEKVMKMLKSLIAPFAYFGGGFWKIIKRVFLPQQAGRLRWKIVLIFIVALSAAVYDDARFYNGAIGWLNAQTEKSPYSRWIKLPHAGEAPWKLGLDLLGGTHLVYEADVSGIPEGERADSLSGVRDVIERRVNAFGVSEPLVQTERTAGHYRIIVELAGIRDVNEAIKMIGETPTLDFREAVSENDGSVTLTAPEETPEIKAYNAAAEKRAQDVLKEVKARGADFSALAKKYSDDPGSKELGGELGYFGEGEMIKEFQTAVAALKIGEISKTPVKTSYGYHIIKKTGEKTVDGKKQMSASHILIATMAPEVDANAAAGWKLTALSGKQLKHSQVVFDPNTNEPTVQLTWNAEGEKLFAEITEANVGKPLGIFLDGNNISAPTVQAKITGGTAIISGGFTIDQAKTLARRLNAGALPVPITLLTQQTIDASLGAVSLEKSLFAGLIGFLAVVVFMLLVYRLPGLLASLALLVYAALTLAVFKILNVTMSLAGIAGFILSIGMAVDANVLIFERLKEELRGGRTIGDALSEGFKRAWNSIRDSNVSSLITCSILIWFGTSTVRGFAITLAIGILVSMFTAIIVTRNLMRGAIGRRVEKNLWLVGGGFKKEKV